MNDQYTKQGYLLEDFRLFHLRGAQGIKTEYHYHEFCKLLLLVSGSGGYWIEGQRYELQSGDMVLLGSHCVHRPDFDAQKPYERVIIYIDPEFLKKNSTPDCDLTEVFSGKLGHVLRPARIGSRRFPAMAEALEQELSGNIYGRVILSSGLLLKLLVTIGREQRCRDALLPGPSQPGNDRVRKILSYIDEHLTEDLNIDSIAEHFYWSKYHMMRLFREETGSSINTYIIHRRLEHARNLLSQGHSATDSCFRSGFGSYCAFTRAYSKYFGTTPTGRMCVTRMAEDGEE